LTTGSIGYAFVLAGVAAAAFGAVVGVTAGLKSSAQGAAWTRRAVWAFFACMLGANLTMEYALLARDFSVKYVAQVGSHATPTAYTIVSLWSALEGSILFWGLILGTFVFAFERVHRREEAKMQALPLGVMLAVGTFFAFLIAGPANPFHTLPNPPLDGPGPNPLLQNHVLMIIHPPMLYLGYVGMTVPFGVAAAALLRGEIHAGWMVPLRRWTLVAWTFLTIGIILGGWWAYAVLGWGGYWAWDPVENASFLPWLTATAFIHSTMVQERKKMLRLWTLALALATFVLTILGTFMTRSGVFNSVHAFTQSDIGPTFLVFLAVLLVFCIGLLTVRGHLLVAEENIRSPLSRETTILLNNLVFAGLTFVVLVGTLHPLIAESLFDKRVSVGAPYFDKLTLPFWTAMLFLMGVGPMLPWGSADKEKVRGQFLLPAGAGLLTVAACLAAGLRGGYALATFGLAAFVAVINLRELVIPVRARMQERREGLLAAVVESASRARRRFGGYIVHLGIVMVAVAVAASQSYVTQTTATVKRGESFSAGRYQVRFEGLTSGKEPHYDFVAARLAVTTAGGGEAQEMAPQMRYYAAMTDPVGTPSVRETAREDFYVSMLAFSGRAQSPDGVETASFNTWVFPLVSWIWWSIPVMVFGTCIALWPSRRARVVLEGRAPAAAGGAAPPEAAEVPAPQKGAA
jgi:cytochrome c-type biogenesis protein CcmF